MKSVIINILSNSLGDTIAALPYVSEYQKINGNTTYFSVNDVYIDLISNSYQNIIIIGRNHDVSNDETINIDYNFNTSVQSGYAIQLGFENPSYIRPKISIPKFSRPIKNKYISLGVHSTSQLKYWNHPLGKKSQPIQPYWNELCSYIRKKGYTPVTVEKYDMFGKEPYYNGLPNKSNKKVNLSLIEAVNIINHSEFYIGLSSGMSWVAHALGKKVVMISNFTEDWNEFNLESEDYIRITNKSVCHGCWNKINIEHSFEPSDWYWCPKHRDTDRQFECHTSITPEMVINQIEKWL